MSDDFLRRLFRTDRVQPVTRPQPLQFLQAIFAGQYPEREAYQRRPSLSQASRFAEFGQPSRRNLSINGFPLADLSPDQRQIILEQARQGAFDFDDFLTRRNPQPLYADMEEDNEAEQAFRQMNGQPKPVAQFVWKNQQAKTPESSDAHRNASSVQVAKQSPQSPQGDKVQKALSRAAAAVTSKKQSGTRPDTKAKSTTKNATTTQGEYKPSPAEEQLRRYFEEYKAAGNIPEANKYAIELHSDYSAPKMNAASMVC